jgi:hypothetical protein
MYIWHWWSRFSNEILTKTPGSMFWSLFSAVFANFRRFSWKPI